MSFVIGIVPVIPMRKEASHRTEVVSSLLFGEIAEVLEESNAFTKIRCQYEGYEGWCQTTQLTAISPSDFVEMNQSLAADWSNPVELNGTLMYISMGTPLSIFQNRLAKIGNFNLRYLGKEWDPQKALFDEESINAISKQYLNTSYLWGGRSVFGIDCSGFVQQVYRFFNKPLPRDAYQQASEGEVVGFLQEVTCGDLAFFDNEEGKITHVGLMYSSDTIIHSSGRVRIDKIDNMGIISSDTGERTHKLRIIKRYL